MTNEQDQVACTRNCWLMGAVAGLVFAAVLFVVAGLGIVQAIFIGIVVAAIVGLLLGTVLCSGTRARPAADMVHSAGAGTAPATAARSNFVSGTPASKPAAATGAAEVVTPSEMKEDLPASAPTPEVATVPTGAEAPAAKPLSADGKPELLSAARPGGPDDLKLISGVGPKLEQTLNELGIYHYDQVASWRQPEVEWVDSQLKFKGRIEREGWIAQARTLAQGGETEFSSRKKKT